MSSSEGIPQETAKAAIRYVEALQRENKELLKVLNRIRAQATSEQSFPRDWREVHLRAVRDMACEALAKYGDGESSHVQG